MRGQTNKLYVMGVFLTIIGGLGLIEIETLSHGLFWFFNVMFCVGIGLCLAGYEHGR